MGWVAVVSTVAAVGVLVAGGAAFAAYRYEQAREDLILPGVTVAGVDVGGLTRADAVAAVRAAVQVDLAATLTIEVGGRSWRASPAQLGRKARVGAAVDEALDLNGTMGTLDRFWHRVRRDPVDVGIDVDHRIGGRKVEALVATIAAEVAVPFRDASIGITDDANEVRMIRPRPGRALRERAAAAKIRAALAQGDDHVRLRTAKVAPEVGVGDLGRTVVVRVDENRLYLYEGFEVVETWSVATAKPGWTTPTGVWNIWDMRVNPTWYNPALDSWGAGLPAVVPGGPNGVMGTRAIYIDAPGLIRIHGTPAPESVGRYASHGCIRMRNEEIERLFEMIEVGQHVVVVGHRPAGAQEGDTPAAFDI